MRVRGCAERIDVVAKGWCVDIYLSAERGVVGLVCELKREQSCGTDAKIGVGWAGWAEVLAENAEPNEIDDLRSSLARLDNRLS